MLTADWAVRSTHYLHFNREAAPYRHTASAANGQDSSAAYSASENTSTVLLPFFVVSLSTLPSRASHPIAVASSKSVSLVSFFQFGKFQLTMCVQCVPYGTGICAN